ncbi:Tetraacyldisaccharide 4'-kinase [Microbacterium sp. Nx66]|nr:Tetraacyldisaccharide 4'-kinase [Microbacterium sp. Nx66]
MGVRLLRRYQDRRRARAAAARQARRSGADHRHGAQRRLPLQRLRGRQPGRLALTAVHTSDTCRCLDVPHDRSRTRRRRPR